MAMQETTTTPWRRCAAILSSTLPFSAVTA